MHEEYSRELEIEAPSLRAFGWTFAGFFLVVAFWPLVSGHGPRWWALVASGSMAAVTVIAPTLLAVPNRHWSRLGMLLQRIVSPMALAIMFYLVVTPLGLLSRALGKDFLSLRRADSAASYWVRREPPGPDPASMPDQF